MFARLRSATVICWAMGITQHRNAVATIQEIVNLAAAAGQHRQARRRAVPGARPLQRAGRPHDGHLGAGPPTHFLDALRDEFGFEPPREHGLDTVDAIRALRDGEAKVFVGDGRQLRRRRARHRTSPRRRCAAPT